MKRDGFLDDIQELVEDFSKEEKKQINTHVDSKIDWRKMLEDMQRQDHRESMDRFQREHLQENFSWSATATTTTPTKRKETIGCNCGAKIEIFFIQKSVDRNIYDWTRKDAVIETDEFHCPRCMQVIKVIGKITELKVKMTE